jgi:hypothetical protein
MIGASPLPQIPFGIEPQGHRSVTSLRKLGSARILPRAVAVDLSAISAGSAIPCNLSSCSWLFLCAFCVLCGSKAFCLLSQRTQSHRGTATARGTYDSPRFPHPSTPKSSFSCRGAVGARNLPYRREDPLSPVFLRRFPHSVVVGTCKAAPLRLHTPTSP